LAVNRREFSRCLDKAASAQQASAGTFQNSARSIPMMDVVMVALGIGFFALSIAYVYACEQL
jgi:hypothetical protein